MMPEVNEYHLSHSDAADFSKMTGAAKIALAGKGIATAGAIVSATVVGSVIGGIIALVGGIVAWAAGIVGNKWYTSKQVRWLVQKYQFFVEGDASVMSDNDVDESKIDAAYAWFSATLGVPIYDALRLHRLRGTSEYTGKMYQPLVSYEKRALDYMEIAWEGTAGGVTFDQALAAAYLADQFKEYQPGENAKMPAGSWKNFLIASIWFQKLSADDVIKLKAGLLPLGQNEGALFNDSPLSKIKEFLLKIKNFFYDKFGRAAVFFMVGTVVLLFYLFTKRKK